MAARFEDAINGIAQTLPQLVNSYRQYLNDSYTQRIGMIQAQSASLYYKSAAEREKWEREHLLPAQVALLESEKKHQEIVNRFEEGASDRWMLDYDMRLNESLEQIKVSRAQAEQAQQEASDSDELTKAQILVLKNDTLAKSAAIATSMVALAKNPQATRAGREIFKMLQDRDIEDGGFGFVNDAELWQEITDAGQADGFFTPAEQKSSQDVATLLQGMISAEVGLVMQDISNEMQMYQQGPELMQGVLFDSKDGKGPMPLTADKLQLYFNEKIRVGKNNILIGNLASIKAVSNNQWPLLNAGGIDPYGANQEAGPSNIMGFMEYTKALSNLSNTIKNKELMDTAPGKVGGSTSVITGKPVSISEKNRMGYR